MSAMMRKVEGDTTKGTVSTAAAEKEEDDEEDDEENDAEDVEEVEESERILKPRQKILFHLSCAVLKSVGVQQYSQNLT